MRAVATLLPGVSQQDLAFTCLKQDFHAAAGIVECPNPKP